MADIAIFDLDYTLTKRGTWGRFVFKCVRFKPWLWVPLAISAGVTQWRYKRGHLPRIKVKQAMMHWAMKGVSRTNLERLAEDFAEREVKAGLRPGAVLALQKHKDKGDVIIIASAAVDLIVSPIAKRLDVKHWVATNMKWIDGKLTSDFASKNCYGREKLVRVMELFAQNLNLKQSNTLITMYSDSYSDIEILRYCDIGVAVNADKRLIRASFKEGFERVDWGS